MVLVVQKISCYLPLTICVNWNVSVSFLCISFLPVKQDSSSFPTKPLPERFQWCSSSAETQREQQVCSWWSSNQTNWGLPGRRRERGFSAVFKSTSLLLLCLVCFFCLFVLKKQKLEMCLRTFLTVFLLHAVS